MKSIRIKSLILIFLCGLLCIIYTNIFKDIIVYAKKTNFYCYQDFNTLDIDLNKNLSDVNKNVNLGQTPHISVDFSLLNKVDMTLYEQINNLNFANNYETINIELKFLESKKITLEDISLKLIFEDNYKSYTKSFKNLKSNTNSVLTEINNEFTNYCISLNNSFESDEYLLDENNQTTTILVKNAKIRGIAIINNCIKDGVLDIGCISTTKGETITVWNNFVKGDFPQLTANEELLSEVNFLGTYVKRSVSLENNGQFDIIKSIDFTELISLMNIQNYDNLFLHIDMEGDIQNLALQYIFDDSKEDLSEKIFYKDQFYLSTCKGIRLSYIGKYNVNINKIVISYNENTLANTMPYFNTDIKMIDSFNINQENICSNLENAINEQKNYDSKCYYRLAKEYNNLANESDYNAYISNGSLKITYNKDQKNQNQYINFSTKYKTFYNDSKYLVIKFNLSNISLLEKVNFYFSETSKKFYTENEFYSDYGLKSSNNLDSYKINNNEFYYVIDIAKSNIEFEDGNNFFFGIDYYGTDTFCIDEIFLANELSQILVAQSDKYLTQSIKINSNEKKSLNLDTSNFNALKLNLTIDDNTNLNNAIFYVDETAFNISEIFIKNGNKLCDIEFIDEKSNEVIFDLNKMQIENSKSFSVALNGLGKIEINNFELQKYVDYKNYKQIDKQNKENDNSQKDKIIFSNNFENDILGTVNLANNNFSYDVLAMTICPANEKMDSFKIDFGNNSIIYFDKNSSNPIVLINGQYLSDLKFEQNIQVEILIDLHLSNINSFNNFDIVMDKDLANGISINDFYLAKYVDNYKMIINNLTDYDALDVEKPSITMETLTEMFEGNVKINYSVVDDNSVYEDIDIKVIVLKDNEKYGCKLETINNKNYIVFDAKCDNQEKNYSIYKVTIIATDKSNNIEEKFVELKVNKKLDPPVEKNYKTLIIIIVSSLIGLALIGCGIFFVIKLKNKQNFKIKF